MTALNRRQFLAGAAVVVAFDGLTGRWLTAAAAQGGSFAGVPPLDGLLLTDTAARGADARDEGNIVTQTPAAVLRPGSARDVAAMVRFCRQRGIKVAMRGQAHTTFGQGLTPGLLIESSALASIHSIGSEGAEVDAGVLWHDLITQADQVGLTPPVITGYTGLSIGGTLSVGGISPAYRDGAQIDHVRALEVVTGTGERLVCSPDRHRDLFDVVRAGLGQCALITRAWLDLVPAPPMARTYQLAYTDNATFFRDQRALLRRGELDRVFTLWAPAGDGLIYILNAVKYFDPADPPDDGRLLRGLSVPPSAAVRQDASYLDTVLAVDQVYAAYQAAGWDRLIKPWFDVWLPDATVEPYIGAVIPTLTPRDVGATGFVLLIPARRSSLHAPLLRVPGATDWVYLFDILTSSAAPGPDATFTQEMLARNRRLFEKARAAGGTRYPIGSIPFTRSDWVRQYGDAWPSLTALKRRYDPDGILTPGPGILP
jgi:cytokinin dehydrogenase